MNLRGTGVCEYGTIEKWGYDVVSGDFLSIRVESYRVLQHSLLSLWEGIIIDGSLRSLIPWVNIQQSQAKDEILVFFLKIQTDIPAEDDNGFKSMCQMCTSFLSFQIQCLVLRGEFWLTKHNSLGSK